MRLKTRLVTSMVFTVALPIIIGIGIIDFAIRSSITKIEIDNSKEHMINTQNYIKSLIILQELNINSVATGTKKWMITHSKYNLKKYLRFILRNN
ncbi:hypothetical protein [Clostridium sp.]|uniref:hypothetical protein n=1 Tax=Clostridium sp. TaxID=1506 RepID=UPI002FC989A5